MENYQDYYEDLENMHPAQQPWTSKTVQKPSPNVPEIVQGTVQKRSVNEKAARNAENRRYRGLILLAFILGLATCFC